MDRERLIRILRDYPGITHVSTKSGALALKFADGTTVDMNPNLAQPITPGETEAECVDRVLRSIAIMQRTPGMGNTGGLSLSHTIPLVRGADYFMSFGPAAPIALSWITDFVGFGLAIDQPGMRCVINEPLLPADHDKFDALQLQSQAINNLHALVPTIVTEQTGLCPGVLVVSQPTGSETAWFADVRAMGRLLSDLENADPAMPGAPGSAGEEAGMWVAIPASRHRLYLVDTTVSAAIWDKLVRELEFALSDHEAVYPVPHTIVDDQWVEWRPEPTTKWRQQLGMVRFAAQQRIYQTQAQLLQEESGRGGYNSGDRTIAPYSIYLVQDQPRSLAFVPAAASATSIPLTDLVVFECDGMVALLPREKVAREFPDFMTRQPDLHPPRFLVSPPTPTQFTRLKSLSM